MAAQANKNRWSLSEYGRNDENWIRQMQRIPCVIAHEYARLRELCIDGNAYGVMLQLKDVMEAILKYEVLRICAIAKYEGDQEFYESIIVRGLVSKALSLGDWMQLATLCIKHYDKDVGRVSLMKWLARYYARTGIVQWRNDRIGHGALALPDDDEFHAELRKYLQALNEVLTKNADEFEAHHMYCQGTCLLLARSLDASLTDDALSFLHEGKHVPTAPFIITLPYQDSQGERKRGIYFFDSQAANNSATSLISYPDGKRQRIREGYFAAAKAASSSANYADSFVDAEFISTAEERAIERAGVGKQFVEPVHITRWLQGCLEKHEKGSFVLRMSRGMGKSTYADKLNTLYAAPVRLSDGAEVRTYHLSNLQQNSHDFERAVEWRWASYYQAELNWYNLVPIQALAEQKGSKRAGMAAFLNACLKYAREKAQAECIVMVFDGLDEIVEDDIWSYFPTDDALDDGVYIVYSVRHLGDGEERSEFLDEQIERIISPRETLLVDQQSPENRAFLSAFIAEQHLSLTDADFEMLVQTAQGRVLQLDMLCELLKKDVPVADLSSDEKIVQAYLNLLLTLYGRHREERLYMLLLVLCKLNSEEGLSLPEITTLSRLDGTDVLLLEMLSDLMPFLRVNRGFRSENGLRLGRNRYKVINDDVSAAIWKVICESRSFGAVRKHTEILNEVTERLMACLEKGVPESDSTLLVLSVHFLKEVEPQAFEWTEADRARGMLFSEYACLAAAQPDPDELTKSRLSALASALLMHYITGGVQDQPFGLYRIGLINYVAHGCDSAASDWDSSMVFLQSDVAKDYAYANMVRIAECRAALRRLQGKCDDDRFMCSVQRYGSLDKHKVNDSDEVTHLLDMLEKGIDSGGMGSDDFKQFEEGLNRYLESNKRADEISNPQTEVACYQTEMLSDEIMQLPHMQLEVAMGCYLQKDMEGCREACSKVLKGLRRHEMEPAERRELKKRALELRSVASYSEMKLLQGMWSDLRYLLVRAVERRQRKPEGRRSGVDMIREQIWKATDEQLWGKRMNKDVKLTDRLSELALQTAAAKWRKSDGCAGLCARMWNGIVRWHGKKKYKKLDAETQQELTRQETAYQYGTGVTQRELYTLHLRAASLKCIRGDFDEAQKILERATVQWKYSDEPVQSLTICARMHHLLGRIYLAQRAYAKAEKSYEAVENCIGQVAPAERRSFGNCDSYYWEARKEHVQACCCQQAYERAEKVCNEIYQKSSGDAHRSSRERCRWAVLRRAKCVKRRIGLVAAVRSMAPSIWKNIKELLICVTTTILGILLLVWLGSLAEGEKLVVPPEMWVGLIAISLMVLPFYEKLKDAENIPSRLRKQINRGFWGVLTLLMSCAFFTFVAKEDYMLETAENDQLMAMILLLISAYLLSGVFLSTLLYAVRKRLIRARIIR